MQTAQILNPRWEIEVIDLTEPETTAVRQYVISDSYTVKLSIPSAMQDNPIWTAKTKKARKARGIPLKWQERIQIPCLVGVNMRLDIELLHETIVARTVDTISLGFDKISALTTDGESRPESFRMVEGHGNLKLSFKLFNLVQHVQTVTTTIAPMQMGQQPGQQQQQQQQPQYGQPMMQQHAAPSAPPSYARPPLPKISLEEDKKNCLEQSQKYQCKMFKGTPSAEIEDVAETALQWMNGMQALIEVISVSSASKIVNGPSGVASCPEVIVWYKPQSGAANMQRQNSAKQFATTRHGPAEAPPAYSPSKPSW